MAKGSIMTKEDLRIFLKPPTLTTERLTLRKITPNDLLDVFEYAKDPRVSRYLLWYPHLSLGDTRAYLAAVDGLYRKGKFYDWGIEINNKMIGTAGFSSFDIENNSAYIGYVLSHDYWKLGIASEAAKAVIKFGFERLGLRRIAAKCIIENEASIAVMKKCKMLFEGVARDALLVKGNYRSIVTYSLTFNEYRELYY